MHTQYMYIVYSTHIGVLRRTVHACTMSCTLSYPCALFLLPPHFIFLLTPQSSTNLQPLEFFPPPFPPLTLTRLSSLLTLPTVSFFDDYYCHHDHLGHIRGSREAALAAHSMYVPPAMFNLPLPPQHSTHSFLL